MSKIMLFMFVILAVIIPGNASAAESIQKSCCLSAVGWSGDLQTLKAVLLVNAKQKIAADVFSGFIADLSRTDDPLLTEESIKAAAAGYVGLSGDAFYFNGEKLGEVCVRVKASVAGDLAEKFAPITLKKKSCAKADADNIAPETIRKNIIREILTDFDRDLQNFNPKAILPLLHKPTYSDESYNRADASFCSLVSGKVYPFEIDRLKGSLAATDGQDSELGPLTIIMKTANSRKPALFPHRDHQDQLDCAVCHHAKTTDGARAPYVDGMKIERCANCHNSDMANKLLNNLKLAGHARCKTCHKNKGISTKCSFCHPERVKSSD